MTRQGLRNAGLTALGWILLWAAVFGSAAVMFNYRFMEDTGSTTNGLLPVRLYAVNYPLYVLGVLITVAAFAAVWLLLLRKCMHRCAELPKLWRAIFVIQYIIGIAGILFAEMAGDLIFMDWRGTEPVFLEYYIIPYMIFIMIWTVADLIVFCRHRSSV